MNLKQLKNQIGTNLRLRPLPIRKSGRRLLRASDDLWQLETILDNPPRVRLVNIHTHHVVELQPDNVREYRSPEFLLLRCRLIMSSQSIDIEPIVGNVYDDLDKAESSAHRIIANPRDQRKKTATSWQHAKKLGLSGAMLLFASVVLAVVHLQQSFTERWNFYRAPAVETEEKTPVRSFQTTQREKRLAGNVGVKQLSADVPNTASAAEKIAVPTEPTNVRSAGAIWSENSSDWGAYGLGQKVDAIGTLSATPFNYGSASGKSDLSSTSIDSLIATTARQRLSDLSLPQLFMPSLDSKDLVLDITKVGLSGLSSYGASDSVKTSVPSFDYLSVNSDSTIAMKTPGIGSLSDLATSTSDTLEPSFGSTLDSIRRFSSPVIQFEIPVMGRLSEEQQKNADAINSPRSLYQLPGVTRYCLPEKIDSLSCK